MQTTKRTPFQQVLDGTFDYATMTLEEFGQLHYELYEYGWDLKLEESAYPQRYLDRVWAAIEQAQAKLLAVQAVRFPETVLRDYTVVRVREGLYPETCEVYWTGEFAQAERVCRWLNRQVDEPAVRYVVL